MSQQYFQKGGLAVADSPASEILPTYSVCVIGLLKDVVQPADSRTIKINSSLRIQYRLALVAHFREAVGTVAVIAKVC